MTIKRFITNLLALFTLFTVSLACKDTEKSIINSSFSISEEYLIQNLDKSSTSVQIPINTSMELAQWSVSYEANWLQCSKQKTAAEGTFLKITVNENTGETKRTANIKVTSTTATYTITVNQYAKGEVIVEGDIKVTPTGGKASEHQEGQDIENTYDGKFSTDGAAPFHTPWGQSAKFPVTLEYYFKGDTEIDYLIYYTRSGNGNFGKVKVYTTTNPDRSDYTLQGEYDFKEQNAPSKVSFSEGIKATGIKFEVLSGLGDFVSCDEMEFYKTNTDKTLDKQLLTVFTDITCTEIKNNVTNEQIQALPDYFVRIAEAVRDNTYDKWEKEFRIRSYEPYSNIAEWADKLMTKKYSDLDNPTGISVKAGDDIIVLVGDTYGQNISMQCIWETGTEYKQTASSGDVYMLNPGVNKLTMKGEGQLFVMYNTELTSNTAKPIKIDIPL